MGSPSTREPAPAINPAKRIGWVFGPGSNRLQSYFRSSGSRLEIRGGGVIPRTSGQQVERQQLDEWSCHHKHSDCLRAPCIWRKTPGYRSNPIVYQAADEDRRNDLKRKALSVAAYRESGREVLRNGMRRFVVGFQVGDECDGLFGRPNAIRAGDATPDVPFHSGALTGFERAQSVEFGEFVDMALHDGTLAFNALPSGG